MSFNINSFRAKINTMGVAKTNSHELRMTAPSVLTGFDVEAISGMCKTVEIPALDVTTFDTRPYGFGTTVKMPNGLDFPTLTTVFLVDEKYEVVRFFREWTNNIVSYQGDTASFIMKYKSSYASTIEATLFSGFDETLKQHYTFYNAYPVTVGNLSSSWENSAEVLTLSVGFAFDGINIDTITE